MLTQCLRPELSGLQLHVEMTPWLKGEGPTFLCR